MRSKWSAFILGSATAAPPADERTNAGARETDRGLALRSRSTLHVELDEVKWIMCRLRILRLLSSLSCSVRLSVCIVLSIQEGHFTFVLNLLFRCTQFDGVAGRDSNASYFPPESESSSSIVNRVSPPRELMTGNPSKPQVQRFLCSVRSSS